MKKNIMSKTYFKQTGTHSFKRIDEYIEETVSRLEVGKLDDYVLTTIKDAIDKINRKLNPAELELLDDVIGELRRRGVMESTVTKPVNEGYYDFFKHQDLLDDATMSEIEGTAVSSQAIEGLKRAATVIWRDMEGTQYEDLYVKFLISTIADQ